MADNTWTVEYQGTRQSCEEWGIEDLQFTFRSQFADELTFTLPGTPFDADRVFAYGETVRVFKKGVQWFVGRVIKPRLNGAAQSESQEYTAVGPWFYLEQTVYRQAWFYYLDADRNPHTRNTSHIVLNGTQDGLTLVDTGVQIRRALQWTIDSFPGAEPFQIGAITPAVLPPIDEVRDLACSEVVRKQLRWSPDAVTWFDYSTFPPTFNCKKYAELRAITLKIPPAAKPSLSNVQEITLESREELIRPAVVIDYEIRATVDGKEYLSIDTDAWPLDATGRELGALVATVDLQGGRSTIAKAPIVSTAIPDDLKSAASLDWWKSRIPELNVAEVIAVEITDADRLWVDQDGIGRKFSVNGGADGLPVALPLELTRGQVADWMPGIAQRERLTLKAKYSQYDKDPATANAKHIASVEKVFIKEITTTNLPSNTYTGPKRIEQRADPLPVGLAKFLFDALQILHWSGSFKLVESELSGSIRPGNVINLAGGRAEWAAMKALVQQVTERVSTGETTITVGPAEKLGISDLIELLKVNRSRNRTTPPGAQGDGSLADGGGGELGKHMPIADRAPGQSVYSLLTVADGSGSSSIAGRVLSIADLEHQGRLVTIDASAAVRPLSIREVQVCEKVNGVDTVKKMLVIGSASY